MANGKYVSYLRVSTQRQGKSGLGLEAQREAVLSYLNGGRWQLCQEFVEVESGKRADRPKLAEALAMCRVLGATLIVAKLDRLARNVHFVSALMESGVDFVAVDFPQANRLTIHILAAVAEHEAAAISKRTKDALAAAKARGTALGGFRGYLPSDDDRETSAALRNAKADARAADLAPVVRGIQASGKTSLRQIAAELEVKGVPTARGGAKWSAVTVSDLLKRIAAA